VVGGEGVSSGKVSNERSEKKKASNPKKRKEEKTNLSPPLIRTAQVPVGREEFLR